MSFIKISFLCLCSVWCQVIIVFTKDYKVLICDSFDLCAKWKKPAFVSNSNKMNLVEQKDTKQKNAIHQDCQKIQSNSSTVKSEDTHSKAWHHITAQFVCTHLHGGRHSHDVICQNHWRSYFHHISQWVLISQKPHNPNERDRFYRMGIRAIKF